MRTCPIEIVSDCLGLPIHSLTHSLTYSLNSSGGEGETVALRRLEMSSGLSCVLKRETGDDGEGVEADGKDGRENKSSRVETGGGRDRGEGEGVQQRWKNYSHRTCSQKGRQSEWPSFKSSHSFAQLQTESHSRTELKAAKHFLKEALQSVVLCFRFLLDPLQVAGTRKKPTTTTTWYQRVEQTPVCGGY